MEEAGDYFERKMREVQYLARLAEEPEPSALPVSAQDLIDAKIRLRASLLARDTLAHPARTETCWTRRRHRLGAFALRYGYQRYDLSVSGPAVYPDLAPTPLDHGGGTIYTASGMAAISSVVLALDRIFAQGAVVGLRGSYYETQHLIADIARNLSLHLAEDGRDLARRLQRLAKRRRGPVVLLADSYAAGNWQRIDRLAPDAPVDVVLFDTTCYSVRSSRIRALIAWTRERRLPTICLRSHLKLDCLGIEYGRLGSVVTMPLPAGTDRRTLRLLQRITETSEDNVRTLGAGALPSHLPPFHGDPAFLDLNDARIAMLRRNNRYAARGLAKALGARARIQRFHHDLFFTIEPLDGSLQAETAAAAASLAEWLRDRSIPARHSGSFGFDFAVIDGYIDATRDVEVIRCAMADLPGDLVQRFISETAAWWHDRLASAGRGSPEDTDPRSHSNLRQTTQPLV